MSMRSSNVQTWNAWPGMESPRWNLATLLAILVAGGALAASWHIAQIEPSLLFARRGGDILGLSHGSFSTGAVRDIFATPHRADDRNHPNFDHGHDAIMLGFPLALLATDRLCFAGVVYEMDGDSPAGAV